MVKKRGRDRDEEDPGRARDFQPGAWLEGSGPESDIAICTRVRLARNLQGFPFAPSLDDSESERLYSFITDRLAQPDLPEKLNILDLEPIEALERSMLVERHLIFGEPWGKAQVLEKNSLALAGFCAGTVNLANSLNIIVLATSHISRHERHTWSLPERGIPIRHHSRSLCVCVPSCHEVSVVGGCYVIFSFDFACAPSMDIDCA